MGFKELTKGREEYIKRKEERALPLRISIKDFRKLISHSYATEILELLAKKDMTMGEIKEHTDGKQVNYFLLEAKKLGIIERYYNKKAKKYYFRLILHENKKLLDPQDRKIQLRFATFSYSSFFILNLH